VQSGCQLLFSQNNRLSPRLRLDVINHAGGLAAALAGGDQHLTGRVALKEAGASLLPGAVIAACCGVGAALINLSTARNLAGAKHAGSDYTATGTETGGFHWAWLDRNVPHIGDAAVAQGIQAILRRAQIR